MELVFKYVSSEAFGLNFFSDTKDLRNRYPDFTIRNIKRVPESGLVYVLVTFNQNEQV